MPAFIHYTGSRLLRVRLLRTPSYNKQVFISKMNFSLTSMFKSSDIESTGYNEHIFIN